jgi:oxalate decarboxylase/phosphoglucose isomerase-like protein (cupin superfamily)
MMTPTKSKLFKSITRNADARGSIVSIVDDVIQNVSLITCYAGSIRSNHYHKKDFHYMYVLEGEIDYFYKDVNSDIINYFKVKKDDIIFTPKNEIHATYFPFQTQLIVSSMLPRDQETYENDTVRVEFIDNENIQSMINKHA